MTKPRYLASFAAVLISSFVLLNAPWFRYAMETETGIVSLAEFSGTAAVPSLNAIMLALASAVLVIVLSAGRVLILLFSVTAALAGLATAATIPVLFDNSEVPVGLQGELEKLTGIAANHSGSGVLQEVTFFAPAFQLALLLLIGVSFWGIKLVKHWPQRIRSAPKEEIEGDDSISIWDSQRKTQS